MTERILKEPIGFGSKVRLKSGGPIMLVIDVPTYDVRSQCSVQCSWLDVNGEPIEGYFHTVCLDHLMKPR